MKRFSERKGFKPISEVIQIDGMNEELRNSIWNVLHSFIWSTDYYLWTQHGNPEIDAFSKSLWANFFKKTVDTRPEWGKEQLCDIRKFFFSCGWFEVYDFLEFVVRYYRIGKPKLSKQLNVILERELSGYRIIDGNIVDITDKQEIEMLEEVLKDTKFEVVNAHLKRSLELYSNREKPDYRNSIKESISAVESIAKIIVGKPYATLGDTLKVLEKKGKIHEALKKGFSSLYGYTSDAGGIRHAMLEKSTISSADAKYFLLSCTSFINYLKSQMG